MPGLPEWVIEGLAKQRAAERKPELEFKMKFNIVTISRRGDIELWETEISSFALAVEMASHKTKADNRDGYENNIHSAFITNTECYQTDKGLYLIDNPMAVVVTGKVYLSQEIMALETESAIVLQAYKVQTEIF